MSSRSWEEVAAEMRTWDAEARRLARSLHDEMTAHVTGEIQRTGASIQLHPPGTRLPKEPTAGPVAMRLDVTEGTAICAHQPHVAEGGGERHRSWPIDLRGGRMDETVRAGITRMVERIAVLQGWSAPTPQLGLDLA